MDKKKIIVIARTVGLEYDDRIRKECLTLLKKANVLLYVNFLDNREEEGVTSYGVPYRSFKLKSRDLFPSSKFLFIKSLEFYLKVNRTLPEHDLIWAHEVYTFIFALLAPKGKLIWDQHEIPIRFEKTGLRHLFRLIEKRSKYIIHANDFRKKYLVETGLIRDLQKHKVIRNFPDDKFKFLKVTDNKAFNSFENWLREDDYVYLQGLSTNKRYPFNTIDSVLSSTDYKIVIAGNVDENAKDRLLEKYGENLYNRVYFRGMVDQLEIPLYLKNAKFTIVLYELATPNNRYCEPNRLYQAIMLGVPVLVGCNEPMAEIVNRYKFGIALSDDGKNIEEINDSIELLKNNLNHYKTNIAENKYRLNWSDQESSILQLIE